jgi:signal transduction histidine kinase
MAMLLRNDKFKMPLIMVLVGGISYLHYATAMSQHYEHIFYRELYFLPIILAGFWFGLKGALLTSASITGLYLPFIVMHWQHFSPNAFDNILTSVLYNVFAAIQGNLVNRERREQQRLREAESLAAMGKALASVAHDIKTPLIAIGGFTRLVQKHLPMDDPDRDKLGIVITETQRMENMVKDMLDFSRPLELHLCKDDIFKLSGECVAILSEIAQVKKVSIEADLASDTPPLAFDSARMKQALINLGMNAIQASSDGDTVKIRAFSRRDGFVIDVMDCGCGIPLDQREKIFQPFFTTKKDGTGLGLPIVRKIIEAHKGRLEILDNPDKGATFRIVLPIVECGTCDKGQQGEPIQDTR